MKYSDKLQKLKNEYNIVNLTLQIHLPIDLAKIVLQNDPLPHQIKRYTLWNELSILADQIATEDVQENPRRKYVGYYLEEDVDEKYRRNFINNVKNYHQAHMPQDVLEFLTTECRSAFYECCRDILSPLDIWFSDIDFRFYKHPMQLPPGMSFMTDILCDRTNYERVFDGHSPKIPYFGGKWYVAWHSTWSTEHDSLLFFGPSIPWSSLLEEDDKDNREICLNNKNWPSYNGLLPPKFICLGTMVDFFRKYLHDDDQSIFGHKLST